ncbi:hypothetical protein FQZ97_999350 [compost metagenome]
MRIHRQNLFRMPRHFNLRDNSNAALGSIGHQFPGFVLCIEAATGIGRTPVHIPAAVIPPVFPGAVGAPGSFFCKFRIFLYFQAPTGPVGDMPMKVVKFVQRHQGNIFFDKSDRHKVPGYIQV